MSRLLGFIALCGATLWLLDQGSRSTSARVDRRHRDLRDAAVRLHLEACRLLGIAEVPLRFTTEVPNAASNGCEVLVNLEWFDRILQAYCDDRVCVQNVVLGILAHEIGHHLGQHAFRPGSAHENELEADRLAGFVLARSGGTTQHLEALLVELSPLWTSTHPGYEARVAAVRGGYFSVA